MDTEQARRLLAAEDAHSRALTNLRNAAAMAVDDSRSQELLEEAGDSYAATTLRLADEQSELLADARRDQLAALTADPAAPHTEATVVHATGAASAPGAEDPAGGGSTVQTGRPPLAAASPPPSPAAAPQAPADGVGDSGPATPATPVGDSPPAS